MPDESILEENDVSIRAPHFHAGRHLFRLWAQQTHCFNPRPTLSCGATSIRYFSWTLSVVSIRAPHFHAGRRSALIKPRHGSSVSIRAPHFHAGRRLKMNSRNAAQAVSIRAPHFHAGRPIWYGFQIRPSVFQSAPHTFMRGDDVQRASSSTYHRFNPRPTLSCGATPRVP